MPIEKRVRVEIFLPIRSYLSAYQVALDWLAEEFAFLRGGATLTTPFAGLFASSDHSNIVEDAIRILFSDFELDTDQGEDLIGVVSLLENVREFLIATLEERKFGSSSTLYHASFPESCSCKSPHVVRANIH